jgi:hypothetical protein
METDDDEDHFEDIFQNIVNDSNSFKCCKCKHRGPIEPYPPFNDKESDINSFIVVREPKQLIQQELVCFHSRDTLSEQPLGIGVSLSRLPRTGEIRSVTPSIDLLSLKAFKKQRVRKAIDGSKFTHWLPLYFGDLKPYEKSVVRQDKDLKEIIEKKTVVPREQLIHLLKKSICWITRKDTRA